MVIRQHKPISGKIDKKQKAQVNNIRAKKRDITTDAVEIMKIKQNTVNNIRLINFKT